jgi:protein-tyrosine phosphatase
MKAGLSFERFPIPDRGVPVSADAAAQLFDSIASRIAIGRSVGVHCRAGIGR